MLWSIARFFLFLCDPETAHHFVMIYLRIKSRVITQWHLCKIKIDLFRNLLRDQTAVSSYPKNPHILACMLRFFGTSVPCILTARDNFERGLFFKTQNKLVKSQKSYLTLWGHTYKHPLGMAAGFDKGQVIFPALFNMGFAFVEIGTVTPRPQSGNPKPRLFRLKDQQALINRMGFNNPGAQAVMHVLKRYPHRAGPVWLNIGKNKDTPQTQAAEDYRLCMRILYPHADAFVLNVSSPNTPQLRDLQEDKPLAVLLNTVQMENQDLAQRLGVSKKPILLKISPDCQDHEIIRIAEQCVAAGLHGLIACNTTMARPFIHKHAQQTGGLSGPVLESRALQVLRLLQPFREKLVLVSVGGIDTVCKAHTRLDQGAHLIELYTSLIYQGPGLIKQIARSFR